MLLLPFPTLSLGKEALLYLQNNHAVGLTKVYSLYNVIHVKLYPTEMSKKDRSIVKATLGLLPYASMCFWAYKWMRVWPDIVSDHLAIFIMFFGLLFGHQVGLMITAHVSKLSFPYFNVPVNGLLISGYLIAIFEEFLEE